MDCPPIPQFCLDFLLRSKTYLKECPPSTSIADFPLSSKPEYVVRLLYPYYKVQIMLLHSYINTRCLAQDVTHYLHCFQRYNIDRSNAPYLSLR